MGCRIGYNRNMFMFLVVIDILIFILLLAVAGICPSRSRMSLYEIERRAKLDDKVAIRNLKIEKAVEDILSLKSILVSFLLILIALINLVTFGWFLGLFISFFVAVSYNAISRSGLIALLSKKIYKMIEDHLIEFVIKDHFIIKLLRGVSDHKVSTEFHINSREEFLHLLDKSENIITRDHRKLIVNGLMFDNTTVKEVMVERLMVRMIEKDELLGPLVLNDLHKSGHSKLPVVRSNFDEVVGVLYLDHVFEITSDKTKTAEDVMDQKIIYVEQDQSLDEALKLMLKSGMNILIVTDGDQNNVGIVTMTDLMNYLFDKDLLLPNTP